MTSRPEDIGARFAAAWNDHDMRAFAELFHPDASFVNRFATHWRGREEIIEGHRAIHEGVYSDSVITVDPPEVSQLSDGLAVLHLWSRVRTGPAHPRGAHAIDSLMLVVAECRAGDWRIRAAENVTLTDPRTGTEVLRGS